MISTEGLEQLFLTAVREVVDATTQLVRQFGAALEALMNDILSTLPRDGWRGEFDRFLQEWQQRGIRCEPESILALKQVIADREQFLIGEASTGVAAINAPLIRLDVAESPGPSTSGQGFQHLIRELPDGASLEQLEIQKDMQALEALGRAIMASHPPEKWLEYAERDASKVALSRTAKERFLQWIAHEQAEAKRITVAAKAIKGSADLSGAEQSIQPGAVEGEATRCRKRILTLLGNDLQNIPLDAVRTLQAEGLIVSMEGGFSNPLKVIIALPREYGAPDVFVLQFVWPWLSPPHWELVQRVPGTKPEHVVNRIRGEHAQKHADVMKARGATIQAQMGAYEVLGSGGSWPLIAQGFDQVQTGGRNAMPGHEADSLISQGAAWYYENALGLTAEEAKKAARHFDEVYPIIAGLGLMHRPEIRRAQKGNPAIEPAPTDATQPKPNHARNVRWIQDTPSMSQTAREYEDAVIGARTSTT